MRLQDEIRQGKRARTCIRWCGCGCGRCTHATVVQQLQCTLAMAQHSRSVSSGARSSVAVGQLVRGGVSKGRTRAFVGFGGERVVGAMAVGVVGAIAVAVGVVAVGVVERVDCAMAVGVVGVIAVGVLGALGQPPSVDAPSLLDGATNAIQGVHDDVHRLHACAQARLPHSSSSGQLWDGSPACGCSRQQDEIRQGKRARTCIRWCGCGCGGCMHATVVQQLECTLAMPQHSRPVSSGARSSVAVGQLVRGGVSKGRTRAVVAVV